MYADKVSPSSRSIPKYFCITCREGKGSKTKEIAAFKNTLHLLTRPRKPKKTQLTTNAPAQPAAVQVSVTGQHACVYDVGADTSPKSSLLLMASPVLWLFSG